VTARHFDLRHLEDIPPRLRDFSKELNTVAVDGEPLESSLVVAIVGTREPGDLGAEKGTYWMAAELASRGVVIASGGAIGIDAAAHEGALSVGGKTWAVIPCVPGGPLRPAQHRRLFQRIIEGGGSVVYTLDDEENFHYVHSYHARNGALVALSDVVIATQIPTKSGTRNTVRHALELNKRVCVVPPNPWMDGLGKSQRAAGAIKLLRTKGVITLYTMRELLTALRLPAPPLADAEQTELFEPDQDPVALGDDGASPLLPLPPRTDPIEQTLVTLLAAGPKHPDELVHESGLSSQAVSRALLTLSLDTVVVDGPDGRYRRCR
jgi:DNA processing protein